MDTNEFKKVVKDREIPNGFIKVTDKPIGALSSEQKAVLNRKGNVLFNEGKIDEACRIFITTGYSDGLTRVGDVYSKKNESLTALKFYILANNARKTEPIYDKLSKIVSLLLKE
ncbi:MAG: hypothetical protein II684_03975 [Treponema sp.]|nr:hypothetical protein [Treponema sp.]MBR4464354.1 hypothetical protein [Treponema sp.]